jgi:hypothetical protein
LKHIQTNSQGTVTATVWCSEGLPPPEHPRQTAVDDVQAEEVEKQPYMRFDHATKQLTPRARPTAPIEEPGPAPDFQNAQPKKEK